MSDLRALVSAPGGHSLVYRDPVFPDRPLVLHAARPHAWTPDTPVLFVHHGVARNGADYRDYWLPLVDEAGDLLAIAIEFSEASFPEYLWYHFGNLHDEDGTPNPRERWTYRHRPSAVRRAARGGDHATADPVRPVRPFRRRPVRPPHAVLRLSRPRRRRGQRQRRHLCHAGPGDRLALRPRRDRARPASLRELLGFPLTVMAGTNDTKTTGRFFPKGPRSMRQGRHRHAPRAQLCPAGSRGGGRRWHATAPGP